MRKLGVCICTYKRPHLLRNLLLDIFEQTLLTDYLIIVDGDPSSGEVLRMLAALNLPSGGGVSYIPSNRGNLSYQRYLGWKAATGLGCDILVYFDDDLRIFQRDAVEKTIAPLSWPEQGIVGVTANIRFGDMSKLADAEAMIDRSHWSAADKPLLVKLFGAARQLQPGDLSPSGHRKGPSYRGADYEKVSWLRGGVMAYRMAALTQECFSADLFALDQIRCGLGEDTFLSRRAGARGTLLFSFCAIFEHPDDDLPKSYPYEAYKFGYASAYSRRLLNDHYRGFDPPVLSDRVALVKSYLGNCALNWWRAVSAPKRHRFAYAWGYTLGACRGLIQKPTAKNLTPHINWWQEADEALKHIIVIQKGRDG